MVVQVVSRFIPTGMGWQRASADPRDYGLRHPAICSLIDRIRGDGGALGESADLREFFPPVEDQGDLNSSCAFAVLGLVEYFLAQSTATPLEGSRLFLYQMALRLSGTTDEVGTNLRDTLKALRRFGVPPQRFWRYASDRIRLPPQDPLLFAFSRDYEKLCYFRCNASPTEEATPLAAAAEDGGPGGGLKTFLAAGIPLLCGFYVPTAISFDGVIHETDRNTTFRGGQAAVIVGYDDAVRIGSARGAYLIRNSWGQRWGNSGYGWIPYRLLITAVAPEIWAIANPDWIDSMAEW